MSSASKETREPRVAVRRYYTNRGCYVLEVLKPTPIGGDHLIVVVSTQDDLSAEDYRKPPSLIS
jgi:hypothetical protein